MTATRDTDPTRVRFPDGFVGRLERLVARHAAAREREAAMGRGRITGAGDEFVGHRPYRPGEELRHLDWDLLARLDRPFVRVHRREAGERQAILLDGSASMGLGRPGKLQLAAEVATGLAFAGLRGGASTLLLVSSQERPASFALRRRTDLAGWMGFLEGRRAAGDRGVRHLFGDPRLAGCDRVLVIGDLLDLEPAEVLGLARRGRELGLVRILAPHELVVGEGDEVRWVDPESGEGLDVTLGPGLRRRYERALESRLETWTRTSARHRIGHGTWSSATDFEDVVRGALAD